MATDIVYAGTIHPLVTDRVTELRPSSIWVKLKKILFFAASGALLGLVIWVASELFGLGWLQFVAIGFGIVVVLLGIFMAFTGKVAPCPYCGKIVGAGAADAVSDSDEPEQIECDHCFEPLM